MAKPKQSVAAQRQAHVSKSKPRSLAISERGIHTGADFARLMSSLMGDIISGRVTPAIGNAACNAGGKLLKVVEMQYKFGTQSGDQGNRVLQLTGNSDAG